MVFFRAQAALLAARGVETSQVEALEALVEAVDSIPDDLLSEQGQAYLRLLSQLAACGLDAAGPPLLPAPGCS
jgi:hypothetical protein